MKRCVLALVTLALAAPDSSRAESYYCEAQGVYTECTTENGIETCRDQPSTGAGAGLDRTKAQTDAVVNCSTHMDTMVIQGNFPSGSSTRSSRAFVKQSCQPAGCKQAAAEAPAPGGGAEPTGFDALMAAGDSLFQAGNFDGAIAQWSAAADAAPKRFEPYAKVAYVQILNGRYDAGCQVIDQGLAAAPDAAPLQLGGAECLIYRRRPADAMEAATRLLGSRLEPDIELGARLIGWIGATLSGGGLAPCPNLARQLASRDQAPGWDLNPLLVFLATYDSPATPQLVSALGAVQKDWKAGAQQLAESCGAAP
jgi:tetratricopeptide (TPR) repeat protein